MSINRSLYIGLSGMNANSLALNVVSDNIANMNTVGYKAGRSVFQEMLGQSVMGVGGTSMAGGGVGFAKIDKMFQQGSLLGTGGELDLAIGGEGFFSLQGEVDGVRGTFYGRNGQFSRDADGFITNVTGLRLMGYQANAAGEISAELGPLQIDDSPIPPTATSKLSLDMNLNANAEVQTFDITAPGDTSDFMSSATVYDAQGKQTQVDVFWTKTADNTWAYNAVVDGGLVDGGTKGEPTLVGSGALEFDAAGNLTTDPATLGTFAFTPVGGQEQTISFDVTGTTQFAEKDSSVDKIKQNGSQSGTFQHVNIDTDGRIKGTFSNGEEKVLGQVALARFKSTAGLRVHGNGLYGQTFDSGNVIMGAANSNGRGQIVAGALEQSNVDLATEFTNMIIAQRGYQANSRSIQTADQVIQEAVNLKR